MTDGPPTSDPLPAPVARSAAAERMRRHRDRQRKGLRCLTIEIRETEIDALVRQGRLQDTRRDDTDAVLHALYAFFERTLGAAR
jgi:hypothetical protein